MKTNDQAIERLQRNDGVRQVGRKSKRVVAAICCLAILMCLAAANKVTAQTLDPNSKVVKPVDEKLLYSTYKKDADDHWGAGYGVTRGTDMASLTGETYHSGMTGWPNAVHWSFEVTIGYEKLDKHDDNRDEITGPWIAIKGKHITAPHPGDPEHENPNNELAHNKGKGVDIKDRTVVSRCVAVNEVKHEVSVSHDDYYGVVADLKQYQYEGDTKVYFGGYMNVLAKHQDGASVPTWYDEMKKQYTAVTIGATKASGCRLIFDASLRLIRITPGRIDVLDRVGGTSGSIDPLYDGDPIRTVPLNSITVSVPLAPDSLGFYHCTADSALLSDSAGSLVGGLAFDELVIGPSDSSNSLRAAARFTSEYISFSKDSVGTPSTLFLRDLSDQLISGKLLTDTATFLSVLAVHTDLDLRKATSEFTRSIALPASVYITGVSVPVEPDSCLPFIYGDLNKDGMACRTGDYILLRRYVEYGVPLPCPTYEGDLDANCRVDSADVNLMYRALTEGTDIFPRYPIRTCNAACQPLTCCTGTRGNVNMNGIIDLADLSALVSYLTGGGFALPCGDAANVNGAGIVDLADLSALVSYLTGGGFVLPSCGTAAAPAAKPVDASSAELSAEFDGKTTTVYYDAPYPVRAVQVDLVGETSGTPTNLLAGTMDNFHGRRGNRTTVILIDTKGKAVIEGKRIALLSVPGKAEIVGALLADLNHNGVAPRFSNAGKPGSLPIGFVLDQNYPNPFNPTTGIRFSLPTASSYTLTIYNVSGQKVAEFSGEGEAGRHSVTFDGRSVASGVYFYRLVAGDFAATKKMLLLK